MYRYSSGQISPSNFKQPAGMNLKETNRWGKKAQTIPWLEIEKRYAALFTNRKGAEARENAENLVDVLQEQSTEKKPGAYRSKAHKESLKYREKDP